MKFTTNLVLATLLGVLTLNVPVRPTFADQLSAEDPSDPNESTNFRKASLGTGSDRPTPAMIYTLSTPRDVANTSKAIHRLGKMGNWLEATGYLASTQTTAQFLQANPAIDKTAVVKLNSLIIPQGEAHAFRLPLRSSNQVSLRLPDYLTHQVQSIAPGSLTIISTTDA